MRSRFESVLVFGLGRRMLFCILNCKKIRYFNNLLEKYNEQHFACFYACDEICPRR
jgi:hypothetical protein